MILLLVGISIVSLVTLLKADRDFKDYRALAAGCDEHDTRPIELKSLIGKIEKFIGSS